ncbi:MAG TPA: cryptochrome/photolyase family protein, partial [Sphingobacterium sp.]|nr:cryptochrome/photolyase family protein [Sphingobacterium sp.]
GTTEIKPVDNTILKVLETGYAHHIERLMIAANLMNLLKIDPDDVYQWFMELFIDSYDWVMVPNVYGMSSFSDGGKMSRKP